MLVTSDLRDWDSPRPAAATATSTATAALDSDDLEFDLGDLKKSSKPRDPYLFLETVDDESSIDLRNRARSPAGRKQDMRAEMQRGRMERTISQMDFCRKRQRSLVLDSCGNISLTSSPRIPYSPRYQPTVHHRHCVRCSGRLFDMSRPFCRCCS